MDSDRISVDVFFGFKTDFMHLTWRYRYCKGMHIVIVYFSILLGPIFIRFHQEFDVLLKIKMNEF